MKKFIFKSFRYTFILIFVLSFSQSALAHGEEPRLEISLDRVNPGSVMEVRGVDFEPEEQIVLTLIGEGFEFPLGEIVANEEGIFLQVITLPADLREGEYRFRAITDDHEIASPTLVVFGTAVVEGGEPLRDEDDPLLAPMPTFAPGVVPGGLSQPAAQPGPQANAASNLNFILVGVLVLLVVASFVVLKFRIARKN